MQFQVPQFIEVEDKIFGPLTFRQFVYVAGGAGTCYILWRVLPLLVAAPVILLTGAFAAALAFFEYNGRPFVSALEHGFFYFVRTKLYLWRNKQTSHTLSTRTSAGKMSDPHAPVYMPKLSDSKLHELAWSLDIKERIAEGMNDNRSESEEMSLIRTARDAMVR